jgi:predicted dehydrogenase/threonine dehydrogenase-like Zn-dependent dehydrogenase
MKQVLQSLKDGKTLVTDVPAPAMGAGQLLIHTTTSLVSAGTERTVVAFGKAGWISKARQQPDKVKMVLEKARTDGVAATFEAVRSKLDQPLALGYCNVGQVAALGRKVDGFAIGDRVVSNGNHAEVVAVPRNLCARIPDTVDDETAAFTVLAAIGLQSIRLANTTIGECVVVTGLGLIGLLTVQILRAQGCRVLGIDFDPTRLALAEKFGAEVINPGTCEDVVAATMGFSRGNGVDAVIITASTTSNDPISNAAKMSRRRGRIILVGVTGLELNRTDFYEKELTFQVSCSYGPGRYDPAYEQGGQDYPIGFVRWTEQRNFEAVLDMMASGALDVKPLISHRYRLDEAEAAFLLLTSQEKSLGILLQYANKRSTNNVAGRTVVLNASSKGGTPIVAFLGAGNYAGRVLIPAFRAAGANLRTVVSNGGVSAVYSGTANGAAEACTDATAAIEDRLVDTIVIGTRHDVHATQVLSGLRSGKHVYCEKPLCLTLDELDEIEAEASQRPDQILMLGFNRRFAPHIVKMKQMLDTVHEPKSFVVTVNAGHIPANHWTQDIAVGGGRIIGEACHFIDLVLYLAGSDITAHSVTILGAHPALDICNDKASITLTFADGSVGTILYLANGHKAFPKERIDVFCAGRVLQLDNFLTLRGWGWRGFTRKKLWRQDKGAQACVNDFVAAVREGQASPIPLTEIIAVSRATIEIAESVS